MYGLPFEVVGKIALWMRVVVLLLNLLILTHSSSVYTSGSFILVNGCPLRILTVKRLKIELFLSSYLKKTKLNKYLIKILELNNISDNLL